VFTDVVGSTALGEEIRDEAMNEVRRAHFAQSRRLIGEFQGREIKTIGDSFMAAFKSACSALDYARALQGNTGHPQVQIRAGIHIGPMHAEEGDVFSRSHDSVLGKRQWSWTTDDADSTDGRNPLPTEPEARSLRPTKADFLAALFSSVSSA